MTYNMEITLKYLEGLISANLEPNHAFLLLLSSDISLNEVENIKIASWVQGLKRKGFLSEDGKVTDKGSRVLEGDFESKEEKIKKRKEKIEKVATDFDRWWETFPSSDAVVSNGKEIFDYTRNLKTKKDECAVKFQAILKEGIFTADELIGALKYDVEKKIKASITTGKNALTYFQNSLTYLNQRSYEGAMKASKMNLPEIKTTTGSVGI